MSCPRVHTARAAIRPLSSRAAATRENETVSFNVRQVSRQLVRRSSRSSQVIDVVLQYEVHREAVGPPLPSGDVINHNNDQYCGWIISLTNSLNNPYLRVELLAGRTKVLYCCRSATCMGDHRTCTALTGNPALGCKDTYAPSYRACAWPGLPHQVSAAQNN